MWGARTTALGEMELFFWPPEKIIFLGAQKNNSNNYFAGPPPGSISPEKGAGRIINGIIFPENNSNNFPNGPLPGPMLVTGGHPRKVSKLGVAKIKQMP